MTNDFLPIGSVAQLKDSSALVMIAGYLPIRQTEPDRVWDYSGFRFPIGYTEDEEIYCFDQEQIEIVYAQGYWDIEEELFMSRLADARRQLAEQSAGQEADGSKEE